MGAGKPVTYHRNLEKGIRPVLFVFVSGLVFSNIIFAVFVLKKTLLRI